MKNAFLFCILSGLCVNNALAQERDARRPTIDWEAINAALAPLENIQLELPRLSTGSEGERQTWLFQGSLAPWDGVLLNPPAAAFIITEYEASFSRANAALERQRASDMNRLRLEVGQLQLTLESERLQSIVQIEGMQREIIRLQIVHQSLIEQSSNGFWKDFLKIGTGTVVGIMVGIVVGLLIAK